MLLSDFFNMLAMAVFACIGGVYYSDGSGRKVDFPFDGGVSPLFPAMKGIPVRFP